MAKVIRANTFDHDFTVCPTASAPWTIPFFSSYVGAMTDGTTLGVFHMPQPDNIPMEDRPLPVVLIPKSQHVWNVGYMYNGQVLPESNLRGFIWAPGNNRSGWAPDEVNWGADAARLFRCFAYKGKERCVTYHPIRNCEVTGGGKEVGFFVQVRRQEDLAVLAMLDTFGPADDLASIAAKAALEAVCKPDQ